MCVSNLSEFLVPRVVGYLKEGAIATSRKFKGRQRKFTGELFLCVGGGRGCIGGQERTTGVRARVLKM